jgi:hypothetical protein
MTRTSFGGRTRRSLFISALLALASAVCVGGCGGGGGSGTSPDANGGRGDGGHDALAADTAPAADTSAGTLVSITVTPPSATLTSTNGSLPTQAFTVMGRYTDGSQHKLSTSNWSIDNQAIGAIATSGVFTAAGTVGGTGTITAKVVSVGKTLSGTASITVNVSQTDTTQGSASDPSLFTGTPQTATDLPIDYPLDGAFLPSNLPPMDIQWENAKPGDVYDIHVTGTHVSFDGYIDVPTTGTFNDDYTPPVTAFRAIEDSSDGSTPYQLTVLRYRAGGSPQLVVSATLNLTFTLGRVAGRVYYWNLGAGQIDVIAQGAAAHQVLGYTPPASGGQNCIACHTVSRDGKSLEAEFYSGFAGPSGVLDLAASPIAATVSPAPSSTSFNSISSAFSPDASKLIGIADSPISSPRLELVSAVDGSSVPMTLPAFDAAYPDWSPDGTRIVFAGDETNSWPNGLYYQGADLFEIPITGAGLFGGAQQIVGRAFDGSSSENAIYAPTYSPDSHYIVFGRGSYSDSCGQDCQPDQNPPPTTGNLYFYIDGMSTPPVPMTNIGAPDENYLPRFSPFIQGGYLWLAYFSRRDYGNPYVGTKGAGAGNAHRRQIWITAINLSATPGTDPSHVPYWLAGQDVSSDNMSAYWAPAPCSSSGTGCEASVDCCSGLFCRTPTTGGAPVCVPPSMAGCSKLDETCTKTSDCCGGMGLTCIDNVCSPLG